MTLTSSSLRVVPGGGHLARRANAVLFTPEADAAELIRVFDAAGDAADAVAAVQTLLVQTSFQSPPFAMVTWGAEVQFVLFGPVEVVTSLVSVPMISGAGSGTWVEHRVADVAAQAPVTIGVADEGGGADEDSDLRLGVTQAGGFELTLTAPEPVAATFLAAPVQAEAAPVAPPPVAAPPVAAPPVAPPPVASPTVAPPAVAAPPMIQAVPDLVELEDEPTLPGPGHSGVEPDVGKPGDRLVEAALCTAGHPNPPLSRMCRVCGLATTADTGESSFISQPALGRLVFADGSVQELDQSMVIGRKPSSDDPGDLLVPVSGDDVSRSHVHIAVRDWDVLITDLSSRNGTYLRVGDDPSPVRLDPGVEQMLETATTIHLGSADIAFRFEQDW